MFALGVIAQELVESHVPPMGPGIVNDSDGFPFATISRPGSLFPGLVVDVDNTSRAHSIGQFTPPQALLPDWFMGVAEVFYNTTISMSGPGYTFDTTTAVATTLTNNNLTATHATNANNSGVKGVAPYTVGLYYYEITVGATHGNLDSIGIAAPGASYTQIANGSGPAVTVNLSTGAIGSSGKSLGPLLAGNIIGIATNVTGLKVYFRKGNGPWNGDLTADPLTGIGGIAIPTNNTWMPVVGFAGGGRQAGDNVTANFGASSYATAAPSGFVNWPTGVMLLLPNVLDADAFYTLSITTAGLPQTLAAGIVLDVDAFFAPIASGAFTLVLNVYVDNDVFQAPNFSSATSLAPSLFDDGATFFAPTVTAISAFDGTLALDGPIMPSTPPLTVILLEG